MRISAPLELRPSNDAVPEDQMDDAKKQLDAAETS